MTFVWTREANDLLTQIYLNQPVVTDHDMDQVIEKIRISLAVVQSEKETETSDPFILPNQLSKIPREEILLRLSTLPECPQPGSQKIDWSRKFRETSLYDYLIQFWEMETQCRISDDLDVKFVPDWSKFYKSVLLLNSLEVGNFSSDGEENDIIPWAHTCQDRIEDIRRGLQVNLPRTKKPVRSKSLYNSSGPCTRQSPKEGGSLLKKNPSKKKIQSKKTISTINKERTSQEYLIFGTDPRELVPTDKKTGMSGNSRSPIVGSPLWEDYMEKKNTEIQVHRTGQIPPRRSSQKHLETEKLIIRSHSHGQSPPRRNSPKQETEQVIIRSHSPGKSHSRQNSQKNLETEKVIIRSHSPGKSHSRQNSQKNLETDQVILRSHSPGKSHSRQNSQNNLETDQVILRSHSPGKVHSRQNSQKNLEPEQVIVRSGKVHSRQNSQKNLEPDQVILRSGKAHSRQNSQKNLETEHWKIRSHSPIQDSSRRNSQIQLETEPWGSSTQSSPVQSPEQRKARSQGTSPVHFRQNSRIEGFEERKRVFTSSKKQSRWGLIPKESEKREMSSQSPSPNWGVEDFLDYDNALSHTSSEI